jgi:hypothetical protein
MSLKRSTRTDADKETPQPEVGKEYKSADGAFKVLSVDDNTVTVAMVGASEIPVLMTRDDFEVMFLTDTEDLEYIDANYKQKEVDAPMREAKIKLPNRMTFHRKSGGDDRMTKFAGQQVDIKKHKQSDGSIKVVLNDGGYECVLNFDSEQEMKDSGFLLDELTSTTSIGAANFPPTLRIGKKGTGKLRFKPSHGEYK